MIERGAVITVDKLDPESIIQPSERAIGDEGRITSSQIARSYGVEITGSQSDLCVNPLTISTRKRSKIGTVPVERQAAGVMVGRGWLIRIGSAADVKKMYCSNG